MDKYAGRRFAGFLVSALLLTAGYFLGPSEVFGSFSTTLGLLYAAYLGGQSATDWRNASVVK